jgi:hypothetical protein
MNRNIQLDKKKINQENKNLKDFSPSNLYRRIKPQQEKSDNNQRSKSRNNSEIINSNNRNHSNSNSNLSKRKT